MSIIENNSIDSYFADFISAKKIKNYIMDDPLIDWLNLYGDKKNIKPAGNPYYLLDKFYGNLSIQEYRQTLSNNRIYFVVDKPKTKLMPELYEDNNDLPMIYNDILNKKPTKNKYVLKRNNDVKENKSFFNI